MNNQKYYLTTAINYTNGPPHIGHAYEAVTADIIARYHRSTGKQVFFLTGTDEHGQKIADTAASYGVTPIELCNKNVKLFQELNKKLLVSNDNFIRTTSEEHQKVAQKVWQMAQEAGDIYLGSYSGWYNVREETFVTESEAKNNNYCDPVTGKPLSKYAEPSYFFKLSKYLDQIVGHIQENPGFVQPESRRKELLSRLKKEGLQDLSISRTTCDWGVSVPSVSPGPTVPIIDAVGPGPTVQTEGNKHVMYVWFDALTNYLSGIGWPDKGDTAKNWPADLHLIGQDINWFHSVIWPAILFSIGLPPPKKIFSHGFVVAEDGIKMSKSLGNTIDPGKMIEKYGTEAFRWYLVCETSFGDTLSFSEKSLAIRYNSELADEFLNLVNRSINITLKYCENGIIPDLTDAVEPVEPPFDLEKLRSDVDEAFNEIQLQRAAQVILEATRTTNKWLNNQAPWHNPNKIYRQKVAVIALQAVYILTHFYIPFLPNTSDRIFGKLNTESCSRAPLSYDYLNTTPKLLNQLCWSKAILPGTKICLGEPLFEKFSFCKKCNNLIEKDDLITVKVQKKQSIYHNQCLESIS